MAGTKHPYDRAPVIGKPLLCLRGGAKSILRLGVNGILDENHKVLAAIPRTIPPSHEKTTCTVPRCSASWVGPTTSTVVSAISRSGSGSGYADARGLACPTSQGRDIDRWRFAPRASTKRNIDTYGWGWSNSESIPWGDQVQDGGAVLGLSYFDLMARLAVLGLDDAWARLKDILAWNREVESEGGYRAYYAKPGRGVLQGAARPVVWGWMRSYWRACSCRRSCFTVFSVSSRRRMEERRHGETRQ
ncbi:MAG: hypothetical protein ACK553_17055 [Planctomycetota bacterium]